MLYNFIDVADIVNKETGLTFRQENNARKHAIPVGSFVEMLQYNPHAPDDQEYTIDPCGQRYFVIEQTRDCDGTPLYRLSHLSPEEHAEQLEELSKMTVLFDEDINRYNGIILKHLLHDNGYSEDCLRVLRMGSD